MTQQGRPRQQGPESGEVQPCTLVIGNPPEERPTILISQERYEQLLAIEDAHQGCLKDIEHWREKAYQWERRAENFEAFFQNHRLIQQLEAVIEHLTMERASFGRVWPSSDSPLPTSEQEVTEFIRRRTQLWRNSWVIGPLQAIVKFLKEEAPK